MLKKGKMYNHLCIQAYEGYIDPSYVGMTSWTNISWE